LLQGRDNHAHPICIGGSLLLLSLAVPGFAQTAGKGCEISGTWYGGSEWKYQMTVTPIQGNRYSVVFQPLYDNKAFGYVVWTNWTGEIVVRPGNVLEAYTMSMYQTDAGAPPDVNQMETDIARGRIEFIDCNTLTQTIDVYAAYSGPKRPFTDPPDWHYLTPGETLTETYSRMPTTCPVCDEAVKAARR